MWVKSKVERPSAFALADSSKEDETCLTTCYVSTNYETSLITYY
jgi:hypothetical protein